MQIICQRIPDRWDCGTKSTPADARRTVVMWHHQSISGDTKSVSKKLHRQLMHTIHKDTGEQRHENRENHCISLHVTLSVTSQKAPYKSSCYYNNIDDDDNADELWATDHCTFRSHKMLADSSSACCKLRRTVKYGSKTSVSQLSAISTAHYPQHTTSHQDRHH